MLAAITVVAALCVMCLANKVVERRDGIAPDRFRLTDDSCMQATSCSSYGGEMEADNSNCNCQCTKTDNTFSVMEKRCIRHLSGCTDFTIGSQDGRIFTFAIIDSKLYPRLAVKEASSNAPLNCKTTPLAVHSQHATGWLELNSTSISLTAHPTTNYTYIELGDVSHNALAGKIIRTSYNCTNDGTTPKCIVFKIRGFQEVEVEKPEEMTEASQSLKKFDITFFFYIAAGCFALLVIASVIAISVACTHTRKRPADTIKVHRLEGNALHINDKKHANTRVARAPPNMNGEVIRGNSGHSRKPIYTKNPNRNSPRRSAPSSPRRSDNLDGSPRRSSRPPSQTSATFIVNENDAQTSLQLRTKTLDSTTPRKSVLKKAQRHLEKQEQRLKVAKEALIGFEGEKLRKGSPSETVLNPKYQVLAGVNASIRGIALPSGLATEHKINNKKHSKTKKGKKEVVESVWSIDYEHFEIKEDDTRQDGLEELPLSQANITASSEDFVPSFVSPRYSSSSNSDNEHGLREFDVDASTNLSVVEFQRQIPATNIDDIVGPGDQHDVWEDCSSADVSSRDRPQNTNESSIPRCMHVPQGSYGSEPSVGPSTHVEPQVVNQTTNIDDVLTDQSD